MNYKVLPMPAAVWPGESVARAAVKPSGAPVSAVSFQPSQVARQPITNAQQPTSGLFVCNSATGSTLGQTRAVATNGAASLTAGYQVLPMPKWPA